MTKVKMQRHIAGGVQFQFASAAQEKIVREHDKELHQASERNGHGDAEQIAGTNGQGRGAHKLE